MHVWVDMKIIQIIAASVLSTITIYLKFITGLKYFTLCVITKVNQRNISILQKASWFSEFLNLVPHDNFF